MDPTMHEAPSIGHQSAEIAEHTSADTKQFSIYSYTGNIADYDDDEIFCSLDMDKANELVGWILDHPFLQSRSGKGSKRRRFYAEIRDKATLTGMDQSTTEALLVYVDKLYAEKRKRFSRKKPVTGDEGVEQGRKNTEILSKDEKREGQETMRNVDDEPVGKQDHVLIASLPVMSEPREIRLDEPDDEPVECLPEEPTIPQNHPLTATDGNHKDGPLTSKDKDQFPSGFYDKNTADVAVSPTRKTRKRNHRKREARKARRAERRAERRASYRAAHTASSKDSTPKAGRRPAPKASNADRSARQPLHGLEDTFLDGVTPASQEVMVSALLEFDFFPSDSSLSDVPSDVSSILGNGDAPVLSLQAFTGEIQCPTPSESEPVTPVKNPLARPLGPTNRVKVPKISPYFPGQPSQPESCLPFPPISASSFGLIQEQLAHDPFRLLVATIFLNRTRGGVAIPVLFKVFERYPTIESMAHADLAELVSMINCLGFQNQRAKKCIALAQTWLAAPPTKGRRYRKLHYPKKMDGRDVGTNECISDDDPRVAWEISHLPGVGAYAIDSWRIFCRDELRGLSTDWKGAGADDGFTPEWKSVHPTDKELRAYLTWMWLKEGWVWDRETGRRHLADDKLMRAARRGGIAHEEEGQWVLETSPVKAAGFAKRILEDDMA
ncbi:hypothetical protein DTO282F9_6224 [Paecilomyces variotii]|nr:hypothetical protein DTO282F9_6224 [Paecilomyces variotii]